MSLTMELGDGPAEITLANHDDEGRFEKSVTTTESDDENTEKLGDHNSNSEIYREIDDAEVIRSLKTTETVSYTTEFVDDEGEATQTTITTTETFSSGRHGSEDCDDHEINNDDDHKYEKHNYEIQKDGDAEIQVPCDNNDSKSPEPVFKDRSEDEVEDDDQEKSETVEASRPEPSTEQEPCRKASTEEGNLTTERRRRTSSSDKDSRRRTSSGRKHSGSESERKTSPQRSKAAAAREKFEHQKDSTSKTVRHREEPTRRGNTASARAKFENASRDKSPTEKRASFSKGKAHTVAGSDNSTQRTPLSKTRTASTDYDSRRSDDSKRRSSSTTHSPPRKASDTRKSSTAERRSPRKQSTADEEVPKLTPSQIRAKFETKSGSDPNRYRIRPNVAPGSAAAARNRFEKQASADAEGRRRAPSGSASVDHADGGSVSAAKMRARFEQNAGADSSPARFKKPATTASSRARASSAAKKFNAPSLSNKCEQCEKTVYPMEKLEADGKVYHKFCFKCEECKNTLKLGNFAALQGKIYCKPHFKRLFRLKGNYDEGFGRQQRKTDWKGDAPSSQSSNPEAANVANGNHPVTNGDDTLPDTAAQEIEAEE